MRSSAFRTISFAESCWQKREVQGAKAMINKNNVLTGCISGAFQQRYPVSRTAATQSPLQKFGCGIIIQAMDCGFPCMHSLFTNPSNPLIP